MISLSSIRIEDEKCLGLRVDLPESPPLILLLAEKGFIMCGFLNVDVAEELGVAAAVVSGVRTPEDALKARVKVVTSGAKSLGAQVGMKGIDVLKRMSKLDR